MVRLIGVEIPNQKRVVIGLQYIFGVGQTRARDLCQRLKIEPQVKVKDLTEEQLIGLRDAMKAFRVEGDLRREYTLSIKRLQEIGCYRGLRHKKNLPCRGQRTRTNARTKRGRRQTVANKKKETK